LYKRRGIQGGIGRGEGRGGSIDFVDNAVGHWHELDHEEVEAGGIQEGCGGVGGVVGGEGALEGHFEVWLGVLAWRCWVGGGVVCVGDFEVRSEVLANLPTSSEILRRRETSPLLKLFEDAMQGVFGSELLLILSYSKCFDLF